MQELQELIYTVSHRASIAMYTIAVIIIIYYVLKLIYKFYLSPETYRPSKIKEIVVRAIIGFIVFMILGILLNIFSNNFAPVKVPNLNLILSQI